MQYVYYVCSTDVEVTVIYYTKYCLQKNIFMEFQQVYEKKIYRTFSILSKPFSSIFQELFRIFGACKAQLNSLW